MPFGEARLVDIHLTHRSSCTRLDLVIALVVGHCAGACRALRVGPGGAVGVQVLVEAECMARRVRAVIWPTLAGRCCGNLAGDDPAALTRARALAAARRGGGGGPRPLLSAALAPVVADYFDSASRRSSAAALHHRHHHVRGGRAVARSRGPTCRGSALAGGAGAINHALDRDLDRLMKRTAIAPRERRISPPRRSCSRCAARMRVVARWR